MGITQWHQDIQWERYENAYIPEYTPLQSRPHASEDEKRLHRDYSPELIQILNACVQFRVENRPTPQELMEAIEDIMPRFTQGMERWGTAEWFEELNSGGGDTTVDDTTLGDTTLGYSTLDDSAISGPGSGQGSGSSLLRRGKRIKDATDSLVDKSKSLMCFPRARRHKRRKTPTDRHLSPFSRERARAASQNPAPSLCPSTSVWLAAARVESQGRDPLHGTHYLGVLAQSSPAREDREPKRAPLNRKGRRAP